MDIHPAALTDGLTRQDIHNAVERALITTHIGNEPTRLLVLGENGAGRLLEISAVVRHEDILVVHAADARPIYTPLTDAASPPVSRTPATNDDAPPSRYGRSVDGLALTDSLIEGLFATAERGYDVERLLRRTRPGRPAPLTVGCVVNVGLDVTLKDAVAAQAASDHVAEPDLVQRILQEYLRSDSEPESRLTRQK